MLNLFKYLSTKLKIEIFILSVLSVSSFAFEIASISLLIPIINILDKNEIPTFFEKFLSYFDISTNNFEVGEIFLYSLFAFLVLFGTRCIFLYLVNVKQAYFALNLTLFLKTKVFNTIFQNYNYVFDKNKFSNFITLIIDDIQNYVSYITSFINIFRDIILAILLSMFLIFTDVKIFIFLILIISLLGVIYINYTNKRFYNISVGKRKYFERRANTLYKIYFGFAELKLAKKIKNFFNTYYNEEKNYHKLIIRKVFLRVLSQIFFQIFLVLSITLVLLLVFLLQKENALTTLGIFTIIAIRIFPMFSNLLSDYQTLKTYKKSADAIFKVLKQKIYSFEKSITIKNWKNLEFRIDNFKFKKNNVLFNKFCLRIDRGMKYLLYGDNGTGKSTLAKLLVGIQKSENSKFFLNGKKLNSTFASNIRIAYMPQKPFLLDGSVYENVTFKKTNDFNSDNYYKKVIKVCLVDQILKKNNIDHNTNIGENGKFISGGESKKIMLARILYSKPSFLILDELLDSIDKKSQLKLIKNIFNFEKKITVLMITHRKIFNNLFDSIIKIDKQGNKS